VLHLMTTSTVPTLPAGELSCAAEGGLRGPDSVNARQSAQNRHQDALDWRFGARSPQQDRLRGDPPEEASNCAEAVAHLDEALMRVRGLPVPGSAKSLCHSAPRVLRPGI